MSGEGGGWTQGFTGSMAGVKNLRVRLDMASVVVRGGTQAGIDYNLHLRSRKSSQEEARKQFRDYKLTSYVKGDTAWVVGEWQGDHSYRLGGARLRITTRSERNLSGELVINVPREMGLVKVETGGGDVDAGGIAGRVEAESGGGNLRLDDIGGGAKIETGGGAIDVGTMSGDLSAHTGGGAIAVKNAMGAVVVETGGGQVGDRFRGAGGAD